MRSSRRAICRGVNADETRPRSFVCRGASMAMNESVASNISGGASKNMTPSPERNVSWSRETCRMSS